MRRPSGAGAWAATGLAALAGFALMHVWVPAEGRENALCLLRRLTGIPCPGCGMTRAFAHLAKGEWSAALAAHPCAPLLALELGLLWLAWGARLRGLAVPASRPAGLPSGAGPAAPADPAGWFLPLVLANLALLWALWLGRAATGTLPW